MFNLLHTGESIGKSRLESGDPVARSASGVFLNVGGAKAIAGWMKSVGGSEDGGAVYIVMNDDFSLQDKEGKAVAFTEGTLMSVPEGDEAFVEFTGISEADYRTLFSSHLAALSGPDDQVS